MTGEWIDNEPRAYGKPRRWEPSEIIMADPRDAFFQDEYTEEQQRKRLVQAIKSFYVIGSLRNEKIVNFANALQAEGYEAFCDWKSPGPDADDYLRDYAKARGLSYKQTLQTYAARRIFEFDVFHLNRCDAAVLFMPAGKSGHLELGVVLGKGKPGFIVFDEVPERVDVMQQFAWDLFFSQEEFFEYLKNQ